MTDEDETFADRLRGRGFTPGVRDAPALLAWWRRQMPRAPAKERGKMTKLVVQALGRADGPVATRLLRDLWEVDATERVLRIRALARIAERIDVPQWEEELARGLADADPRVVRATLRAVGKLDGGERFEGNVVALLPRSALPEQRAATETLGRISGEKGLEALRNLDTQDAELLRRRDHAIALIERRLLRSEPCDISLSRPLPQAMSVVLRCRSGAEPFATEQARDMLALGHEDVRTDSQGVALSFAGTLAELHRVRIALDAALVFDLVPGSTLGQRIAETLSQPALLEALDAWTDGPLRFRLSFSDGASRRSVIRDVSSILSQRALPLFNDSREAPWSVVTDVEGARVFCVPQAPDLRFGYRRRHIPAASHPTLAALMAWVARPRPQETVWDPFCGTGSELIECAHLEPSAKPYGTDLSADALTAAAANFEAARLAIAPGQLVRGDALQTRPGGSSPVTPSLIITNPPMGRRVTSGYNVHQLLRRFVTRAAELLPVNGRLVWVTPAAKVSATAGQDSGLRVTDHGAIDLNGLRVHLQEMTKRPR